MSTLFASRNEMPLDGAQTERLDQALTGLAPFQLQWVSGYAAGLALADEQTAIGQVDAANSLTILYGSQTGNGEGVAKALESRAREQGFQVTLASLADYKPASLRREKLVTLVVSTHGEGDPPDDAELFHEYLLSKKAPKLDGLQFSVLALGDSSYVNFCATGREFDTRLEELGGERLLPLLQCDLDYEGAANGWSNEILAKIPALIDAETAVPHLRAVAPLPQYNKQRPFPAEILVNQKITGRDSSKDVRHIELSLEGSGLRYEPGDSLAVVVENPPQLVAQFLEQLALDADSQVTVQDELVSLADALTRKLEITAASLGVLRAWAEHSDSQALRSLLNGEANSQAQLSEFLETHQIIDIVRQHPVSIDAQSFVDSLRKLSPRSYSIASSLDANPDEVHLTVAAVRYSAFGSKHWGAASTQLADRLAEGDSISVYIEPNTRFRLPSDRRTDVIMIGPGTGVAPFRAFVEERAERDASGRNWLFFGDRNFSSDFLYQLEWHRHLKNGQLDRLDVAFSRDQEQKIYVQDRIRENGDELFAWIENGANIYVCGDAKHMAGDVDASLVDVLTRHGGQSEQLARKNLKEMRRAGRYQRDVY